MLFNSAAFILGFLPVAWVGFFLFGATGHHRLAVGWLTLASLFFYSYWNPTYLPLLLGSIAFNYVVGRWLIRSRSMVLLVFGVAGNLILLGYYKYAGFLVQTVDAASGAGFAIPAIALPLAISFFTFQQIAFLVDSQGGVAEETHLSNYAMFITFFPHLIAGPITHHREILPQFDDKRLFKPQPDMVAFGLTLFLIGLCKKVLLADTLSHWVKPLFGSVAHGAHVELVPAWIAGVGYTFQMYFDFSGYSDMAIGLGLLFGIRLPLNFNSPYKALNIIDYWSRWHMTLTRFLTAYIYNPIVLRATRSRLRAGKPGLKKGKTSLGAFLWLVGVPTLLTMFLAGLWHGAGWQFIVFGVLHGCYLVTNHGWRAIKARRGWPAHSDAVPARIVCVLTTFVCVMVALVFFRAASVSTAIDLLASMVGLHGVNLPHTLGLIPGVHALAAFLGITIGHSGLRPIQFGFLALMFAIVWALPNSQQWLGRFETALGTGRKAVPPGWLPPVLNRIMLWRPNVAFGVLVGCVGFFALMRAVSVAPSEFLYFKF